MTAAPQAARSVLVIEDDAEIADLVALHLRDQGLQPVMAGDGAQGLQALRGEAPALVILDLMLPDQDGLEVCKRIRAELPRVPLLMLTARSTEMDKVLGLELGADDYLAKPFGVRELIARVRALLRRSEAPPAEAGGGPLRHGALEVDPRKRRVTLEGAPVSLTTKEFDLLHHFARQPGVAFTRDQLLDQVWGYSFSGYEHTVNAHIHRLRAKIEADPAKPQYILTVWGYGYRFADRPEVEEGA